MLRPHVAWPYRTSAGGQLRSATGLRTVFSSTFILPLLFLLSSAFGAASAELFAPCAKTLWLAGLHLNGAHYIHDSSYYLRSYYQALLSRQQHSPELVPVLIIHGDIDDNSIAQVQALGGHVVRHSLSFMEQLTMKEGLHPALIGSWLRLDIKYIMPNVLQTLGEEALRDVDTDYVLWTDPDVIFMMNINSCTIPHPRYLAIAADATPYNKDNCGVIYYNVAAYSEMQDDLIDWGTQRKFDFYHDQKHVLDYFEEKGMQYLQQLPDIFNWKPYWGTPVSIAFWTKTPDLAIIHTHGPKPALGICMADALAALNVEQHDALTWIQDRNHFAEVLKVCPCETRAVQCESLFLLAAAGYQSDAGAMFKQVAAMIEQLDRDVQQQLDAAQAGD